MIIKLIITNVPNTDEDFTYGLDAQASEELASLYNEKLENLEKGNIKLVLPTRDELNILDINSTQLNNLLSQHVGQNVCILQDGNRIEISKTLYFQKD
jgi:hypothetical protein